MRTAAVAALALGLCALAAACGGDDEGAASNRTELTVVYREDAERPETEETWSVTCDPPAGTHPDPAAACAALDRAGAAAFAPPPDDRACAEIYGGPQQAIVTGTVEGEPVEATFRRRDGCEIEAWDALRGLLPPGGVS